MQERRQGFIKGCNSIQTYFNLLHYLSQMYDHDHYYGKRLITAIML